MDWARRIELISVLIAALVGVAGLWYSNNQVRDQLKISRQELGVTREGQITDRYTKAVENLGDDAMDVRLGGVYALQRIMEDSRRDHPTVANVLATFIRTHTAKPRKQGEDVPADVHAALTVLIYRDSARDDYFNLDLRETQLSGIELRRRAPNGDAPELSEANLAGANLFNAALSGVNLRGANLSQASLHKATLVGVNLRHSRLFGADLRGAFLSRADLRHANLYGANLRDTRAFGADLRGAILSRADLRRADLIGADLTGADLTDADLTGADLTDADLTDADLTGADLTEADLTGADLTEAVGVDLPGADLSVESD
ncbi:pentapeptide repeat-containing protein [Streptomyces sp. NPDC029554]|uniref:pentapeptide repeat-containing protein n=1 Tax=Streptomyces sp. NPDC029554 TaxID=3155126 RepID=UPI0034083DCF